MITPQWERQTLTGREQREGVEMMRGGGAHNLYKVTYIRHLKSRGLSVTKLTKKRNGLFVTKMREFSKGGLLVTCIYENLRCFISQKRGSWGDR